MRIIDSHTEGEPTRIIIDGGPVFKKTSLAEQAAELNVEHREFLNATLTEPRGFDAMIGAILRPAVDSTCASGVIFYTTAGALGMCGHASIGLAVTLAHMGRIGLGRHKIETPVGIITVELKPNNEVSIQNVESYRFRKDVKVSVAGVGVVIGDIAWGGNWFYILKIAPCDLVYENISQLHSVSLAIRTALAKNGITGADGAEIDHVEFNEPSVSGVSELSGRNFVLCPNGTYDRSPCGTGTSAKLACLAADGMLKPNEVWIQESIIGSCYSASFEKGENGGVVPTITGKAYVTGEGVLIQHRDDPYANGIALALDIPKQPLGI